jgi:hypothetical protein
MIWKFNEIKEWGMELLKKQSRRELRIKRITIIRMMIKFNNKQIIKIKWWRMRLKKNPIRKKRLEAK